MSRHPTESIFSSAKNAGWNWFDQVDEKVKEQLDINQSKATEDSKGVARAWADFYATPGGRKALDALFDTTFRRITFFVHLGLDVQSMAVYGAFREGQNALAYEIARQINLAHNEETKPRDIT